MKSVLFILVITASIVVNGQDPGVIRYDYDSYDGPIKKGWLFNDMTYRKVYRKLTLIDTVMNQYEKIIKNDSITISNLSQQNREFSNRIENLEYTKAALLQTVDTLEFQNRKLIQINQEFEDQFWHVRIFKKEVSIHKWSFISGVAVGGVGVALIRR